MSKDVKLQEEFEIKNCQSFSDNVLENIKYIKKLELQRTILHKLLSSDLEQVISNNDREQESPDSN